MIEARSYGAGIIRLRLPSGSGRLRAVGSLSQVPESMPGTASGGNSFMVSAVDEPCCTKPLRARRPAAVRTIRYHLLARCAAGRRRAAAVTRAGVSFTRDAMHIECDERCASHWHSPAH